MHVIFVCVPSVSTVRATFGHHSALLTRCACSFPVLSMFLCPTSHCFAAWHAHMRVRRVYKKGKRTGFDRFKREEQQRLEATEAAEAALALASAPNANGAGNDNMDAVAVGEAQTLAISTATAIAGADV